MPTKDEAARQNLFSRISKALSGSKTKSVNLLVVRGDLAAMARQQIENSTLKAELEQCRIQLGHARDTIVDMRAACDVLQAHSNNIGRFRTHLNKAIRDARSRTWR